MAMERRVMKEMKLCGPPGSPNKLVEEVSSSRVASKVFAAARGLDSASRAGKAAAGGKKKPAGVVKAGATCKICAYMGLDSGSCSTCVAKAAALERIKAAGGDSIKAAEEAASRACSDPLVIGAVPSRTAAKEEGKGIVKKTVVIPEARIKMMMADPPRTPLAPLPDDFFDDDPSLREPVLAMTLAMLEGIAQEENILMQYFNKGHAVVEWEIDYGQ